MLESFIPLVITSLCIGVAVWAIFIWAVKSGQFDDIEGPKHRMMDDDDDEPQHDKTVQKDKDGEEGANNENK